jgi:RNA polymerase sigma-70 factor (ECF subfamily)
MIGAVTEVAGARFWAGLGAARRANLQALPGWEQRLAAALDAPAEHTWLPREEFAAELAARFDGDDEEAARWWDHLHAADLYLACACARGIAGALAAFERTYGEEIARTARRFERPGLAADDLLQRLRTKLFTSAIADEAAGGAARPPKIAAYTGQGFLQNWVRVTTTRTFIDCCRWQTEAPEVPLADELLAILPEEGADPELGYLKREHAAHFKDAFAEAVTSLASQDRVLLRQHFIDRLTVDQLGALYHLHRATAARRLAKARQALLDGARGALARRLGLPAEDLANLLELVASRLEVSFERLLR